MTEPCARERRLLRLLEAARQLANPTTKAGNSLRRRLQESSGLSPAGIELGLERCLETQPTQQALASLLAKVPEAPASHVLLSANVFVAALRAIAIGVVASPRVLVRASRRDPVLAEALHELAPELFELVRDLLPQAGDHVWAYGSDPTLAEVRASLPTGVHFHAHGSGMGVVVVEARPGRDVLAEARAIALDAALFDQRGCLSPRMVCVLGSHDRALELAQALASALVMLEEKLPLGAQSNEEMAEVRRFRDTASYAFELLEAGSGGVSLSQSPQLLLPPPGRNLHVAGVGDVIQALKPFERHVTCIGQSASEALRARLALAFPHARHAELGKMQSPPLDGPVDWRPPAYGELLGSNLFPIRNRASL